MNYVLHLLITFSVYVILAHALNVPFGFGGMLSLCQAAFLGLGAYCTTLLLVDLQWSFFPALLIASVLAGAVSLGIGLVSFRFRGIYFALTTLAFQAIAFAVMYNWQTLTRGPLGIAGIPRPILFRQQSTSLLGFAVLSVTFAVLVIVLSKRLGNSAYARSLLVVREDETVAAALGKSPIYFKATAFFIGASVSAVAGALYAVYFSYIDPTAFSLDQSVSILSMLIIGGGGNLKGPTAGAAIVVFLPELLRFMRVPDAFAPNLRQIIYGILIIVILRFRPQGLAGRYAFE